MAVVDMVQLAQAPIGVLLSALLLPEAIDPWAYVALAAVGASIGASRRLNAGRPERLVKLHLRGSVAAGCPRAGVGEADPKTFE